MPHPLHPHFPYIPVLSPPPPLPAPPLHLQTYIDPDEIFQQHQKTCSLDEVFANGEWERQGGDHLVPARQSRSCCCGDGDGSGADPCRARLPAAGKSKQDLNRRTSSGNWIEDRVTWKEEMNYKKAMRYI